jgi:hypothetical protein
MYLAYPTLLSGLFLSIISEYFSIIGLMTIFSATPVAVAIMGVALGIGKIVSITWLKQNWNIAPLLIKIYMVVAISILMLITSLGCFGLLAKAHSDQTLVSGDVQSRIAVYDEKIKTAKENIEANRKALKQMDEAVDQTMGRSTSELGADRAVQIRRSQQKERARIAQDIEAEQKKINLLLEERAPIAAEVRKVEAEVGPVKYIASFIYGEADKTILEKAVTWVIILIVVVFDPLAVILLLASQISFQSFRERDIEWDPEYSDSEWKQSTDPLPNIDDEETNKPSEVFNETATATQYSTVLEQHPYLAKKFKHFENLKPLVYQEEAVEDEDPDWKRWVENAEIPDVDRPGDYLLDNPPHGYSGYVQNEEQSQSNLWKRITQDEYLTSIKQRKG